MTWEAYYKLIQLIAFLANKYGIPILKEYIAFHDEIIEVKLGCEECRCTHLTCFLCDVSNYCETCSNSGDPSFIEFDQVDYIYGEFRGCKIKIPLATFIEKYVEVQ